MIVSIEVEIGHELGLYIIHGFVQRLDEFVEILFVQEDLVPVVAVVIKTLAAFGDGEVIIVAPGSSYIEEIGPSFSCADALAVNAFDFVVIVLVRHSIDFYSFD